MTGESSHPEPTLSLDAARQIDRLCEAFEVAWKAGRHPQIEDSLPAAAQELRPELVRELIQIDLFYRRRNGESPQPGDYLGRFAEIEATWLETLLSAMVAHGAASKSDPRRTRLRRWTRAGAPRPTTESARIASSAITNSWKKSLAAAWGWSSKRGRCRLIASSP